MRAIMCPCPPNQLFEQSQQLSGQSLHLILHSRWTRQRDADGWIQGEEQEPGLQQHCECFKFQILGLYTQPAKLEPASG